MSFYAPTGKPGYYVRGRQVWTRVRDHRGQNRWLSAGSISELEELVEIRTEQRELRLRAERRQGNIYFVAPVGGGPIKIGWTKNVSRRLAVLQCGSPVELELLVAFPAEQDREAELHQQFASARLHGEWFEPVPELRREVARQRRLATARSRRLTPAGVDAEPDDYVPECPVFFDEILGGPR